MCTDDDCGCNDVISKRGLPGERGPVGPTGPQGPAGGGTVLDENVIDAINASNDPSDTNPFVTTNDISDFIDYIPKITRNFKTNPLSSGASFTVATTLPIGRRLSSYAFVVDADSDTNLLNGDQLNIGIETDEPFYIDMANADINYGAGPVSKLSSRTTTTNRNIKFTAVGAGITSGILTVKFTSIDL